MSKEINTLSQRTKEELTTKIVHIIGHYDKTEEGKKEVFEVLACLLVAEADMLFCEEHMASSISSVINEYMAIAREEREEE